MKLVGDCVPNDIWQEEGPDSHITWKGQGLWSAQDILRLLGFSPKTDLEIVTGLSNSTTNHPLLQTVVDGRADVATIEFGITLNRLKIIGKYNTPFFSSL